MVPMQMSALEHDVGNDAEDGQRDALLNDLQLNEVEGSAIFYKAKTIGRNLAAVFNKAKTIGRNLAAVFKEGDAPREYDDTNEWPVATGARLL